MTPNAIKVLSVLATAGSEFDPWYLPFKPISQQTGLDTKEVRRLVRGLARKGYAEFSRGLWTEDGQPAGSGYAITKEGRAVLERAREA